MHSIKHLQELYRVVATLYVTDLGVFRAKPTKASSVLEVQVVYRICHVDRDGRVVVQDFRNPFSSTEVVPTTGTTYNVIGGPVYLDKLYDSAGTGETLWFTEGSPGKGAIPLRCVTNLNDRLSADLLTVGLKLHAVAKFEEGFGP